MNTPTNAELIVLASSLIHADSYYNKVADDIVVFHTLYAKSIEKHGDNVLILSNEDFYDHYVTHLGANKVALVPMPDIWMRDFTLSNTINSVMFRYSSAASQGNNQHDADTVQEDFFELAEEAHLSFSETDLINDGGNFVDGYTGNVVISKKFLRDNNLSEGDARKMLSTITQ